jgi:hypothetical protein
MFKRVIGVVILAAFVNLTFGCHRTARIEKEEMKGGAEKIIKLALIDGRQVKFDDQGGRYIYGKGQISGYAVAPPTVTSPETAERYPGQAAKTEQIIPVNIPIDSVLEVWVQKNDPLATVLLVIGITAAACLAAVAIVAALKESCPFVYSYDGERYVFDAEPLGGAICEGLQRSECSRLEYLKPVDGQYRLKIRNEVPEIQYLDEMKLLVVDHAPDQTVVPDTAGRLHLVSRALKPERAVDENNRSIAAFVSDQDGMAWQSRMSESDATDTTDTRHHLTFEFPKPADATKARLIVNAGTAIWGSNMIREMLQLRGADVDNWYDAVNRKGLKALELLNFNLREELYLMKVYVQKDSSPVERTLVFGGGPFVTEDRVIEMDVSDIPGDRLVLKMNPPKGFWSIDYLAVEYDNDATVSPQILDIASASGQDGRDIRPQLAVTDSTWYIMPKIGDWADISFEAPAVKSGSQRSIFLQTTGYYDIQIDRSQPEQTALLNRILREPGAIVSYSMQRYLEWHRQQDHGN